MSRSPLSPVKENQTWRRKSELQPPESFTLETEPQDQEIMPKLQESPDPKPENPEVADSWEGTSTFNPIQALEPGHQKCTVTKTPRLPTLITHQKRNRQVQTES